MVKKVGSRFTSLALGLVGLTAMLFVPRISLASTSTAPAGEVAYADALGAVFPEGAPDACAGHGARCLLSERYAGDAAARRAALALFDETGSLAGVEAESTMDGGYRGQVRIVPEWPVGVHAKHLNWVLAAQREVASLMGHVIREQKQAPVFRCTGLQFRFMRTIGGTTPSAYADGWTVTYNVSGSLMTSPVVVRDLMVHEIFHLNDLDRNDWSRRVLGPTVDRISKKCGTDRACLAPYAPRKLTVRGGTFYSFQPNNGDIASEYSAELAARYVAEQLDVLNGKAHPEGWFKCGNADNAYMMKLLREEFFAGFDATPPCPL
jgi:hypothetical protein